MPRNVAIGLQRLGRRKMRASKHEHVNNTDGFTLLHDEGNAINRFVILKGYMKRTD